MRVYTVHDSAANAYMTPFFAKTRAVAIRMLEQSCADTSHIFFQHSQHFKLFEIGSFDEVSGMLSHFEPDYVVGAHEVVAKLALEEDFVTDPESVNEGHVYSSSSPVLKKTRAKSVIPTVRKEK